MQISQSCICSATGQLVVGRIACDWQNPRTLWDKDFGNHSDVGQRIVDRNKAVIGWNNRDTLPTYIGLGKLFQNRFWR